METDQTKKYISFRKALKRIMATEDGALVKQGLSEMYINNTALVADSQLETSYRLGQKEFVQGLIADSEADIPEINLNTGE